MIAFVRSMLCSNCKVWVLLRGSKVWEGLLDFKKNNLLYVVTSSYYDLINYHYIHNVDTCM